MMESMRSVFVAHRNAKNVSTVPTPARSVILNKIGNLMMENAFA
jgi:hypothetical protein